MSISMYLLLVIGSGGVRGDASGGWEEDREVVD